MKWLKKRKRIKKETDEILKRLADDVAEAYNKKADEITQSLSDTARKEEASL